MIHTNGNPTNIWLHLSLFPSLSLTNLQDPKKVCARVCGGAAADNLQSEENEVEIFRFQRRKAFKMAPFK